MGAVIGRRNIVRRQYSQSKLLWQVERRAALPCALRIFCVECLQAQEACGQLAGQAG